MYLEELRTSTLEWLDNPSGDTFAPDGDTKRLDGLLSDAYEELVPEVEASHQEYNVVETPITIAVSSANREYTVSTPGDDGHTDVRKIVEVERTDVTNPYTLDFCPFSERNASFGGSYLPYLKVVASERVYVYQLSDGFWRLGFRSRQPVTQTVDVWYVPAIARLTGSADIPVLVPRQWHRLIPLLAAMNAKGGQTNRDVGFLVGKYQMGLGRMHQDLARLTTQTRSRSI